MDSITVNAALKKRKKEKKKCLLQCMLRRGAQSPRTAALFMATTNHRFIAFPPVIILEFCVNVLFGEIKPVGHLDSCSIYYAVLPCITDGSGVAVKLSH